MNKAFLIFFIFFSQASLALIPQIKVRIGKELERVIVSGDDIEKKIFVNNGSKNYSGKKTLKFDCRFVAENLLMKKRPLLLASLKSSSQMMAWDKTEYHGDLMIFSTPDQKRCDLVNQVSLEDYLATLLNKEVNGSWPKELLKAQAVAARSYAYHKLISREVAKTYKVESYYDLESSEKHQVSGSAADKTLSTTVATRETFGEILVTSDEKIVPIFYHSKCGGRTLTPDLVWGNKVPGMQSVPCSFCYRHGKGNWEISLPKNQFEKLLQKLTKNKRQGSIQLLSDRPDRVTYHYYQNNQLETVVRTDFRKNLGRDIIRSNNFRILESGNLVQFKGEGNGHGVGMCQFGALEMAQLGWDHKKILHYYFPQLKIKKIY